MNPVVTNNNPKGTVFGRKTNTYDSALGSGRILKADDTATYRGIAISANQYNGKTGINALPAIKVIPWGAFVFSQAENADYTSSGAIKDTLSAQFVTIKDYTEGAGTISTPPIGIMGYQENMLAVYPNGGLPVGVQTGTTNSVATDDEIASAPVALTYTTQQPLIVTKGSISYRVFPYADKDALAQSLISRTGFSIVGTLGDPVFEGANQPMLYIAEPDYVPNTSRGEYINFKTDGTLNTIKFQLFANNLMNNSIYTNNPEFKENDVVINFESK